MEYENGDFTIFTESNESMGILYNSYKPVIGHIVTLLSKLESRISDLKKHPESANIDLAADIAEFKTAVNVQYTPSGIMMGKINQTKRVIQDYRKQMDLVLDRVVKVKQSTNFGGNFIHGIVMKGKIYSKDINPDNYDRINSNIRNFDRAFDWIEKVLIDTYNMIDQDLNILTIVGRIYGKKKIYESTDDILDESIDIEPAYEATASYSIRATKRSDVTDPYFVEWFFKNDDFKDISPEKFDFNLLVNQPGGRYQVFGYFEYNRCEGTIVCERKNGYYHLEMFYVNPAKQNKGIGSKLMRKVIAKLGTNELRLNVFASNKRAIHVYEKAGFKKFSEGISKEKGPLNGKRFFKMKRMGSSLNESAWYEDTNEPPSIDEDAPQESFPKQTDKAEASKNGVRRKKLYIAFIEWAKSHNQKNAFGSIFDKDAFKVTYPFVPDEMRYFYRLANPILCVLGGGLTFFQVSELRKLNAKNPQMNEILIFAATPNDMRVFNTQDKKVYRGTDENGSLKLNEVLGDTFDLYIQKMINQGDILNETEDSTIE